MGTDLALTEISGSVSGTNVDINVSVANPDGANHDVYLRHREYTSAAWTDVPAFQANSTQALFPIENLTNDAVHEFEASLDQYFNQETTLTLYLTVGNPPYSTVTNGGVQDPNNNGGTQDPNNNGGEETNTEETNTEETNTEETNTEETNTEETNTEETTRRRLIRRRLTTTAVTYLPRRPRIAAATRTTVVARSRRTTAAVAVAEASATVR